MADSYKQTHAVAIDSQDGFRHLDPLPSEEELAVFYKKKYYELAPKGGRIPDIDRLMKKDDEAQKELRWLEHTLYTDIADVLDRNAPGKRVLEIGCGMGQALDWLRRKGGFEVYGIEPSETAAGIAAERGIPVFQGDFAGWLAAEESSGRRFDAILFLNVVEHLADPETLLSAARELLAKNGVLCVRVPNDFSEIQLHTQAALDKSAWWISVPDHIHYFTFDSLERFLARLGYEPFLRQGDFPMELFLLMGDDYLANPEEGKRCHKRRVTLEMTLGTALRQRLSRALADLGVGRNAMVFARKGDDSQRRVAPRVDMSAFRREQGPYTYVGLRREDIQALREFRNAQMDVLRQKRPLTEEGQERWYTEVVLPMHAKAEPSFLLVSILDKEGLFLGYGGLTYIDWDHRRAEVSFLMDPKRVATPSLYREDFLNFLLFLKTWSFDELGLHRLFGETYAFRDFHISVLEEAGFLREGHLKEHILDPKHPTHYVDCIVHGLCAPGKK